MRHVLHPHQLEGASDQLIFVRRSRRAVRLHLFGGRRETYSQLQVIITVSATFKPGRGPATLRGAESAFRSCEHCASVAPHYSADESHCGAYRTSRRSLSATPSADDAVNLPRGMLLSVLCHPTNSGALARPTFSRTDNSYCRLRKRVRSLSLCSLRSSWVCTLTNSKA